MVDLSAELAFGDPVMGIDEAGRGPLAGRVYAAAVHVPLETAIELLEGAWHGINDSKQLSERRRDMLAGVIRATPGCRWAVAFATPEEIDRLNILKATHLAMRRAAEAVGEMNILVDGLAVSSLPYPSRNIVKGDAKSLLIAAASILAKTARDEDCLRLEALYPGYGFAQHKGYPTKAHYAALRRLGPCPEHRRSFNLEK